jgi:hypothetical protein
MSYCKIWRQERRNTVWKRRDNRNVQYGSRNTETGHRALQKLLGVFCPQQSTAQQSKLLNMFPQFSLVVLVPEIQRNKYFKHTHTHTHT